MSETEVKHVIEIRDGGMFVHSALSLPCERMSEGFTRGLGRGLVLGLCDGLEQSLDRLVYVGLRRFEKFVDVTEKAGIADPEKAAAARTAMALLKEVFGMKGESE